MLITYCAFIVTFIFQFLGQSVGSVLVDSTTPVEITTVENIDEVDTCANFKISTRVNQISRKFFFEQPGRDTLNQSDGDARPKYSRIIVQTLNLDDERGGNWTLKLGSYGRLDIHIEFNVTFPEVEDEQPNTIFGTAVLKTDNFTKELRCYDAVMRWNGLSVWRGFCSAYLEPEERSNVFENNSSITVFMNLAISHAFTTQAVATGLDCNALKLDSFTKSEGTTNADESPSSTAVTQQETSTTRAKTARKLFKTYRHRTSLQWTISDPSQHLAQEPRLSESSHKLGVLRVANDTHGIDWLFWVELLQSANSTKIAVELAYGFSIGQPMIRSIDRLQVGLTFGHQNYMKIIPMETSKFYLLLRANKTVTAEELAELKNGLVLHLEWEAVYAIRQPRRRLNSTASPAPNDGANL